MPYPSIDIIKKQIIQPCKLLEISINSPLLPVKCAPITYGPGISASVPRIRVYNIPVVELRLLGAFTLTIADSPVPALRAQAGSWLLALLALRGGKSIDREELAAALWPESLGEQARYNLRRNLTDLRRVLGSEAGRLHSPTPRSVALDLTNAFCDVLAFDTAMAAGQWEEAVRLYTGPLLPRCDVATLVEERNQRELEYVRALEALVDAAIGQGRWPVAVLNLRRILERQPTHEPTVRSLMRALVESGDRGEALLSYRRLRLRLHQELLGDPEPETTALYEEIRSRPAVKPTSGESTASLTPRTRLPIPLTPLRGREGELESISDLLCRHRWLTLVGMGGIGKTRLALETARRWSPEPGDVVWVELASLRDSALVSATVRQALDIPLDADLTATLGNRNLLLTLDNCEHLVDAIAAFSENLLISCPGVRLLCTSREPTNGTGEALFRVSALQEDAARQLFRERARALNPNYEPNSETDALCRALDGWPLAIELAAAQIRSLPTDRILEQIRHMIGARRSGPERHRSLQAALDWSWELLTPQERSDFCRLSVFSGGWTFDAAEAICFSRPEAMIGLVDKSLAEFDGERYVFREPVRQYADEHWQDTTDRATVSERHRRHFLMLVEEAAAQLSGPDEREGRRRLNADRDNLRLALSTGGEVGLRIACALCSFWIHASRAAEGQYWLAGLLATYTQEDALRAQGLYCAGKLASARFQWDHSLELMIEAADLFRTLGDLDGLAHALASIGGNHTNTGRFAEANAPLTEALSAFLQTGNVPGEASCREALGFVARSVKDYISAAKHFQDAMALYRRVGDEGGYISSASQMAFVRLGQHDLVAARAIFREVLDGYRELDRQSGIAWTLCCLGSVERRLGELFSAREHVQESLERFQEAGNNLSWPLLELGRILFDMGDFVQAHALIQQARSEAQASGAQSLVEEADFELRRF